MAPSELGDYLRARRAQVRPDEANLAITGLRRVPGLRREEVALLAGSRIKDYIFDVDKMITFNGNTGVYLQYAHARIRSILAKVAAEDAVAAIDASLLLEPSERSLALLLDELAQSLIDVADTYEPHHLAGYPSKSRLAEAIRADRNRLMSALVATPSPFPSCSG